MEMEAPIWTEAMSVGDEHLDAQHQALFEAAGRVLEALEDGQSEAGLQEVLAFLRRYTLRHFVTEETLLVDSGFPGLAEHRAIHAGITSTFLALEVRIAKAGPRSEALAIKAFIQLILNHIQSEDAAYAPYLRPEVVLPGIPTEGVGTIALGFPSLDEDHARFLALFDQLQEALHEDRGDAELPGLLEKLLDYAKQHFRREELLMDLVDYPDKADHVEAHGRLMQSLVELQQRHLAGQGGLALVALGFLKEWLLEHIGSKDMALVPFLSNLKRI